MYSKTEVESNPFLAGLAAAQAAQVFEVWPENMPAINLYSSLSTQWIIGPGGPTGLNYIPLFNRLDRLKLSDQDYEWMFSDIQAIESEVLAQNKPKD